LETKVFEEENFNAIWDNLANYGVNKGKKAYIFIDEIQNLPIISRVVKYLYDHYETKFFLTGSSSFYLKNLFPESLAGRKFVFELFPLTFGEFLVFKEVPRQTPTGFKSKALAKNQVGFSLLKPYFREYLEFGGFPKVVLEKNHDNKRGRLEEIFKSYFEKDVKTLADFQDRSKLRDLILLLIPRLASRIEINKLSTDLSLSRETVYNYLAFLEETYFIKLLPRFSRSIDRSAAGRRKLFLTDTGLANFLGKASLGQLFENAVFQTLRPDYKLYFYQKERAEIDFITDEKTALEAKTTVSKRELVHLKNRAQSLKIYESYAVSLNWSGEKEVIPATDL
jgi:predicted AAA+ superfamily ATPase